MKKVIIIGAGPAGLCAALELQASGKFDVTIVESDKTYVGGISRTVEHNGNRMDLGPHRFFSKSDRVNDFWSNALDMPLIPRQTRILYRGKFFDYPISLKWQTLYNLGLIITIKAGFSYLYAQIRKLPETSLENFYINRFGRVLYGLFFESYTEKVWGRHPSKMSADWGSQRVKGLSITTIIKDMFENLFFKKQRKVETSLIDTFHYPPLGAGSMYEAIAKKFTDIGGKILFDKKVTGFEKKDNLITSVVCDTDRFEADIFISSMPLKDLVNGLPNVPSSISNIAKGLPYRDFITIALLLPRLMLKDKSDDIADNWIYIQDVGVKVGRMPIFNNFSREMLKDPDHTIWIGMEYFCTEGDDLWMMTEAECLEFAKSELVKIGVISEETEVLDYRREFMLKAYPAYFDTYAQINELILYLNTIPNLWCIGRNGQHRYNNMDHSIMTGLLAADALIYGKVTKSDVWNVNTENDYHEIKSDTGNK